MTSDVLSDTAARSGRPPKPGRLVRLYFWSRLFKNRFTNLVHALFAGFWLGVMSHSDLESVDDAYYVGAFRERESPIDYASAEYNKRGLYTWERQAVETHFPAGGSIALMAAGGGREVLALLRMSFRVDAWECQPALIESGNALLAEEDLEPSIEYAPRNAVPTGAKTYDALIIGWGAYTLIPGRRRRIALLRELRAKVDEGAPMLLSFFTRRPGNAQFGIAARVGNLSRRLLRRERIEPGDWLEPNFVHYFTEPELIAELSAGGFELESFIVAPYGHSIARATAPEAHPDIE